MSGFETHIERTARKRYTCGLCGLAIRPGDRYAHRSGRHPDAGWWSTREHIGCHAAASVGWRRASDEPDAAWPEDVAAAIDAVHRASWDAGRRELVRRRLDGAAKALDAARAVEREALDRWLGYVAVDVSRERWSVRAMWGAWRLARSVEAERHAETHARAVAVDAYLRARDAREG